MKRRTLSHCTIWYLCGGTKPVDPVVLKCFTEAVIRLEPNRPNIATVAELYNLKPGLMWQEIRHYGKPSDPWEPETFSDETTCSQRHALYRIADNRGEEVWSHQHPIADRVRQHEADMTEIALREGPEADALRRKTRDQLRQCRQLILSAAVTLQDADLRGLIRDIEQAAEVSAIHLQAYREVAAELRRKLLGRTANDPLGLDPPSS